MDALVVVTNRPDNLVKFVKAWQPQLRQVKLIVMYDNTSQQLTGHLQQQLVTVLGTFELYDQLDVAADLPENAWIISEKTSASKSYGIYKAWQAGAEIVFNLDDDCLPLNGGHTFFMAHKETLGSTYYNHAMNTVVGLRPRGMPYLPLAPCALSHGAWTGIPDVDAINQLVGYGDYAPVVGPIPRHTLFPFCGMNWAAKREILPLMYFGLQGPNWKVDRYDDIWCGFIAKKVLDQCGYAVHTGMAIIKHDRASDPFTNLEKEASGYKLNVKFFQFILDLKLSCTTIKDCMKEVAETMYTWAVCEDLDYFKKYSEAIQIWLSLFRED